MLTRFSLFTILGFTLLFAFASIAATLNIKVPIPPNTTVFNPCTVENVDLSGNLHLLIHVNSDGNGGFHLKLHANAQGISGVGQSSGNKYQGTGAANLQFNAKKGVVVTAVLNANLISKGSADNASLHVTLHLTVNANNNVTATVVNVNAKCKG